ncbi:mannose-1-phosphate guanylyltransferase [Arthrobacter sp. TWP1-1]|uniref:mannose-1-phosphate guanylyltransferase n=1 Tax=Arthrobacter sp. TWP1-1 TaxID=2804568 RepID=UPI003CF99BB1
MNTQIFGGTAAPTLDPLDRFYAVIPAGGVGTRLWPLSRAAAPKFLHDLTGSGSTLIRATYDRLEPLSGSRTLLVTGDAHREAVCRQLPEIADENLVLETEPKDSGAAIGLAAAILFTRDPSAIMGSFAADQVISPVEKFQEAVREAIYTAATGKIVTIGIKPTHASTGFGYIRIGEPLVVAGAPRAHAVAKFVEKPNEEIAEQYFASGEYSWNAGMFVAPVELMLQHLKANEPTLYEGLMEIALAWDTPERVAVKNRVWPTLPKIAIDYAVAEPAADAGDVAVIPADFSWDDVGDFAAIARLSSATESKNVKVIGDGARVFTEDSTGIVVSDTKRVIALVGIQDVVVVDTPDALLITTLAHSQLVKKAVDGLKAQGNTDVL